jgi:hypothetical protein
VRTLPSSRRRASQCHELLGSGPLVAALPVQRLPEGLIRLLPRRLGMALMLSLESRHAKELDRDHAVTLISEGAVKGFFPALEPARRKR